jgi:hypothetical protein
VGPEVKLYKKLKAFTPQIIWNKIENLSLPGMPDLLGYNTSGRFFTVELKVTKGRKIRFSPHQIAWHVQHPNNTYILVQALGPRAVDRYQMFRGSRIMELDACGLELRRSSEEPSELEACWSGLEACSLELESA